MPGFRRRAYTKSMPEETEPAGDPETDKTDPHSTEDAPEEEAESGRLLPFLIVGIGGSAGGTEAYISLLEQLPPDTGMTFVIAPHLSAGHVSHLREILARRTPMPVSE